MSNPEKALSERIRELRRRHFGPRGKAEFARRLGLAEHDYERFERGAVPPPDVLVGMCETTGEDLQWLLTGVAARGSVVITGARGRHQQLLARTARLLDEKPERAGALEAFVDLLCAEDRVNAPRERFLPPLRGADLIVWFEADELPDELPPPVPPSDGGLWLPSPDRLRIAKPVQRVWLETPGGERTAGAARALRVFTVGDENGRPRRFVRCRRLSAEIAGLFAVRVDDDTMEPMLQAGDAAVAALSAAARVGRPALCKLADEAGVRCRVWLGESGDTVQLGRLSGWEQESVPRAALRWSREVLYRLRLAA